MMFDDLKDRGMGQPALVISDGAKGLTSAIERCFPLSYRGRCLAHKMRNLLACAPKTQVSVIKPLLKEIFYAPSHDKALEHAKTFTKDYGNTYTNLVKTLNDDLEACVTHLRFPAQHHRFIRTTHQIERTFAEQKRRTKVIPTHQNERGCVQLVFAALRDASQMWNSLRIDPNDVAKVRELYDKRGKALNAKTEPIHVDAITHRIAP